jgi:hypothetical protein
METYLNENRTMNEALLKLETSLKGYHNGVSLAQAFALFITARFAWLTYYNEFLIHPKTFRENPGVAEKLQLLLQQASSVFSTAQGGSPKDYQELNYIKKQSASFITELSEVVRYGVGELSQASLPPVPGKS